MRELRVRFPGALYDLIPALYPHLAEVLHSAEITGPEFLSLSFVKNTGKQIEAGATALPLADLKALLIKVGEYESDGGASGFITGTLENRHGYLKPGRLTPDQKTKLFPHSPGYRDVVIITQAGADKLIEVNRRVERLFDDVTKGITGIALRAALNTGLRAFQSISKTLIARLQTLPVERLGPERTVD